jgi:cytochrome c-type biogenesis protein
MLSVSLSFLAGVLSVLSPCVLPLLPIVLGSAVADGRRGPLLLAAGLTVSFVGIGLFVALIGWGVGLDSGFFRAAGAVLMIVVGTALAVPMLQGRFAVAAGPVSGWIDGHIGGTVRGGQWGQFGIGVLLGAVWSPCVGPTLGAASLLAAKGESLGQVTVIMVAFGMGAALPLVLLGHLSREMLLRWRARMLAAGNSLKTALGALLAAAGLLILTGQDKRLESALIDLSPLWLTELTTRF